MWLILSIVAAASAGLTTIFTKIGLKNADSDVATFLRTGVVLLFALGMALALSDFSSVALITPTEWAFLLGGGLATGFSWLFFYKALQIGKASHVAPVKRLSTVLTMSLALILFNEPFGWLTFVSMALILGGAMLMIVKPKKKLEPAVNNTSSCEKNRVCNATHTASTADLANETNQAALNFGSLNTEEATSDFVKLNLLNTEEATLKVLPQPNTMPQVPSAQTDVLKKTKPLWLIYAVVALGFASASNVLARAGMQYVDVQLGTLFRTVTVLLMAFFIVLGKKKLPKFKTFTRKNYLFLTISGILTGISWLAFFNAMVMGYMSVVVAIDKLSILVTVAFSTFVLKEKLTLFSGLGLLVLTAGTLLLLL